MNTFLPTQVSSKYDTKVEQKSLKTTSFISSKQSWTQLKTRATKLNNVANSYTRIIYTWFENEISESFALVLNNMPIQCRK